jgi:hypothetical protein
MIEKGKEKNGSTLSSPGNSTSINLFSHHNNSKEIITVTFLLQNKLRHKEVPKDTQLVGSSSGIRI